MEQLAERTVRAGASVGVRIAAPTRPALERHYYAFLSYSHKDARIADWLQRELERFRVPRRLAGRVTANGVVPHRLNPIFRDRHELAAARDLTTEIKAALAASQYLVVLCSPEAAASHWIDSEIDAYKRARPEGCVLAVIVAGEPFASDLPGREAEECFPPALRVRYDRRGRPTAKRAEPLASDLRQQADGKRLGLLKLIAGMLGVGVDELVQRDTIRRQRHLAWLAAGSLLGMAVTSTLAVTAFQARNSAAEQRREAEGLISFMLGDLKDKLEPIGRLDALDGVGNRVLAYYRKQDASELSDSALMQRSKALSLMASVADARGDLVGALRLYAEAMVGTAEAMRRKPTDPQRIFDHAQNVFYVGAIALRRGDVQTAEAAMRSYKQLSDREVALDPKNMTWRMEAQNAGANLGVLLYNQRRYQEAAKQLQSALAAIDALVSADPNDGDYQKSLVESLAWVADAHMAAGQLDLAVAERQRDVAVLTRLANKGDSDFRSKLIAAQRVLARLYAVRGRLDDAIDELRGAESMAVRLLAIEPANSSWNETIAKVRLDMAQYTLAKGDKAASAAAAQAGCTIADALYAKDPSVADWRALRRDCLRQQAEQAIESGTRDKAVARAAEALVAATSVKSSDPIEDRFAIARAYQLLGDTRQAVGDRRAAEAAWQAGLTAIPRGVAERPGEISVHATLLQRLGRNAEAAALIRQLATMGYREPELRSA